jgi:hypothetical protein
MASHQLAPFLKKIKSDFSNVFGWRPLNLSKKSHDPQEISRPSEGITTLVFACLLVYYTPGVARLFCSRANFQKINNIAGRNKIFSEYFCRLT